MNWLLEHWYSLKLKTRDKIARAAKTAAQTFVASLPLALLIGADSAAIKAALLSAASAAVSAAWNTIFPPSSGEAILIPIYNPNTDTLLPPKE